jgi:hypothetical protein
MKSPIIVKLGLLLLSISGVAANAQSIPNPYFEWFDGKTRSVPVRWSAEGNFTKVDGITLSNSTAIDEYSSISVLKFDDSGLQAPAFKINGTPDSLKVTFKSALNSDTAFIYFMAMKSGDSAPAVFQELMIHGNHNLKTQSFALDYIHPDAGVVCDTAYIIIYSANPVNGPLSNGSISISGLQLFNGSTVLNNIPNGDFSLWENLGVTYPGDWTTHHMVAFNSGLNGNFTSRSNAAHTGSNALWLKGLVYTAPNAKNDSFPAFCITTRSRNMIDLFTPDLNEPSFSYPGRPQSFRGYAKTQLVKGDRLMGFVNLFNADSIVASTVLTIDSTNGKYSLFENDINWLPGYTGNCDKATIAFYVTDSSGLTMVSPESQAWIDNIAFGNFGVNTKSTAGQSNFSVYPNPAKDYTRISISGSEHTNLYLMNMDGRIIRSFSPLNDGSIISLSGLAAGMYLLTTPEKGITKKIIINP